MPVQFHRTSLRLGFVLSTGLLGLLYAQELWFVGPSHTVSRSEAKPASSSVYDAATKTVILHAARNEFVSFQIVYSGDMKGVTVEPLVLAKAKDQLPAAEFFREHWMPCPIISQYDGSNRPGDVVALNAHYEKNGIVREFPSQLVPQGATKYGFPFAVAVGKNEAVWVDQFVPENTAPGIYTGTLTTAGMTVTVSLTVWNFTLPSVSHFPNWVYIGPEEIAWAFGKSHRSLSELRPQFDAYFEMAHNHRICLLEEWGGDPSYVKEARGYWDHQTGKAFKGPFAPGIGYELIQLDSANLYPLDEITQQGWLTRAFTQLRDEPGDQEAYEETRVRGRQVREATQGKLRRLVTEQDQPTDPSWGSLDPEVDIYCSGAIPVSSIPDIEKRGKVAWTYNGGHAGSPYIDAPFAACRTHAWAGFVSGARAWLFWDGGYIVDKQFKWREKRKELYATNDPTPYVTNTWDVAMNFDETLRNHGKYNPAYAIRLNGDGLLFYPGMEVGIQGPIACIRLKNIRQGTSDFEYLYLLEKSGQRESAVAEASKLLGALAASGAESKDGQMQKTVRFDNYELDGDKWEAARIRLGKILHAVGDAKLRTLVKPYNQYPNPAGYPEAFGGKRY